jgi:hypothetical protein
LDGEVSTLPLPLPLGNGSTRRKVYKAYLGLRAQSIKHGSLLQIIKMEQCVFAFSLIAESTTEKVLQFQMPLKSIYNKNLGFIEQKMYF